MGGNRRHFLKSAGLATTASMVAGWGSSASAIEPIKRGREPSLKLSIAGYSFRKEFLSEPPQMTLLEDFVDFAARHGIPAIEPTSYYFPESAGRDYFHALKRRSFLAGLDISGTAVGNTFTLPPGEERDKQIQHTKTWIDNAVEFGAPCIRIFAGAVQKGDTEEKARRYAIECIQECLEYAAHRGVFLALENHGGIVSTADQLLAIVNAIDSSWFGVNLDTGNFRVKDPYADIEKAAPFAINVQLKVEMHPAGQSKQPADLPRVIDIIKRTGYRGYVALEYEAGGDARTDVPRYLDELQRLI